jgi:Uma2 family endonuclease
MQEIILPDDVTPALEWVGDRIVQKMSPTPQHSVAQGALVAALLAWARAHHGGSVGVELRFQLQPPGKIRRTLVPDVCYVSYERMSKQEIRANEAPRIGPEVVFEVLSPGDRRKDLAEKIDVYLSTGTQVIFLVDLLKQTVKQIEAEGTREFAEAETVEHASLPGFSMPVRELFELP